MVFHTVQWQRLIQTNIEAVCLQLFFKFPLGKQNIDVSTKTLGMAKSWNPVGIL